MKIGEDREEYPIVIASVSKGHSYAHFIAVYKEDDGSAGYISVALEDCIDKIRFTSDNTAKILFRKEEHRFSETTLSVLEIYIPEKMMFNN